MNKLQPQITKYCINTRMGKYLYYFASEADAVIAALEAENERLREALYKIQNEKCMARAIEIIEEAILS